MKIEDFLTYVYNNNKEHVDQLGGFNVINYLHSVLLDLKTITVNWDALQLLYGDYLNYIAMDEDGG